MKFLINQLCVSHGKHALLDIEQLTIEGPGLIVISGPSGAGKSTLLMALAGLIDRTNGHISLDNEALTARNAYQWRQQKLGYLFQSFELIPVLSALDNVLLRADAMQVKPSRDQAETLLSSLGISNTGKPAKRYSRGQQQRIALARALYGDPSILLCDEPTASLDGHHGGQVADILADLSQHKLIIVSTHDQVLIKRASQVITLAYGKLIGAPRCAA